MSAAIMVTVHGHGMNDTSYSLVRSSQFVLLINYIFANRCASVKVMRRLIVATKNRPGPTTMYTYLSACYTNAHV